MITLRQAAEADRGFLLGLFASSREELLAAAGWDAAGRAAFVEMQYEAQQRAYRSAHPGALCSVIERAGGAGREPIGRLWLDERPGEFQLLDIALLPPYRGQGVGTFCLQALLLRAAGVGADVNLHVEASNPAFDLYRSLGFVVTQHHPPYLAMQWTAAVQTSAAPRLPTQESRYEQA
jgi:ribosomal protein S18 acetylase RimI-like enzyme